MPYNCEECGKVGARLNSMLEIRLCENCVAGPKYRTICKSIAMKKYKLTDLELGNAQIKHYLCKNPHWKSGPAMTLYLETDIQQLFLQGYTEIITDVLKKPIPLEPISIDETSEEILNWIEEKKNEAKHSKYKKILDKHYIELEDLPKWVRYELVQVKSMAEYERVLTSYMRLKKLYFLLKSKGLEKYINLKISHDYIYQCGNFNDGNIEQIPILIKFMLNKKEMLKKAILQHKLPKKKYAQMYHDFMNTYDTSPRLNTQNDLSTLIAYIQDKEYRLKTLTEELGKFNLTIRSDSVLCSRYLNGSDEKTPSQIADIMNQMNWFFNHTDYSSNTRDYDRRYGTRRNHWEERYYRYRDWDGNEPFDSDYESDYDEKDRETYNKEKSEYVKNQCLTEWIKQGKKGVAPPDSLNDEVMRIEMQIEANKMKEQEEKAKREIAKQKKLEEFTKQKKLEEITKQKKLEEVANANVNIKEDKMYGRVSIGIMPKIPIDKNQLKCANKDCVMLCSLYCTNSMCGCCCNRENCGYHTNKYNRKTKSLE